jgi:hypothetical protein
MEPLSTPLFMLDSGFRIRYRYVRYSVADPGSGAFLPPGSGMGKKSGSGIRIRDEPPGSYFRELKKTMFWVKILKFFDVVPGSGSGMDHPDHISESLKTNVLG